MLDLSARETYTKAQLTRYFDRISLPAAERESRIATSLDASTTTPEEALRFLTVLKCHNLASVPFENLELHYSLYKNIGLDPQHLFHKIVDRGAGRGGYCMENNCFFGTVLRSLGYDVCAVGARVNDAVEPASASRRYKGPRYSGWNHMLNIVRISDKRYNVDVGFGSVGPTRPLELVPDAVCRNVGTQSVRLVHAATDQNTDRTQKLWQYEHRNSDDGDWKPTYCFAETEFFPEDFAMMNYFVSTHRSSWFTYKIVCVKKIMDKSTGEIIGDLTLSDRDVKRRIESKTETLAHLECEEDRVKALREVFGVTLSEEERWAIQGMMTDLL